LTRQINGHKLRRNWKATLPSRMMFYDSETKFVQVGSEQHHTLDFGWLCYCRNRPDRDKATVKHYFIDSTDRFNSILEEYAYEHSTLYVFAHNVFFDLQVSGFFKYFTQAGWTLDFYYDKGLVYILSIRNGSRKILCLSTTNYFSEKLASLGESVGRKKTEIDFEKSSRDEKIEYCFNDMLIVKEAMEMYFEFLGEHDMGKFGLTKSAQAFGAFRHRFMHSNIFIHEEEDAVSLERAAYHGGRTEAFRLGRIDGGPFVCLDVNSMYPFIMQSEALPNRLVDYGSAIPIDKIEKILEGYAVIAHVKIKTDVPIYCVKRDFKLIYPVGTFDCHLCTPGLKLALSKGHIKKIYQFAVYDKENLFESYVKHFYKLRQQYKESGNAIYEKLCKLFMNTLYGKFGQKRMLTEKEYSEGEPEYTRIETYDMLTWELQTSTKIFNTWIMETGEENGRDSFVAIPAHITEYGRLMLWEIIKAAGKESCIYCDTDSVILPESSLERMLDRLDERKLGRLKLEYHTKNLVIHGCKDYETDQTSKIKGVPRDAQQLTENSFKYNQFLGQSSHLRLSVSDYFIIRETVKVNKRIYDKGNVDSRGYVTPFSLGDV